MANYQIAFDNADITLGNYFVQSKVDLITFVNANDDNNTINEISSPKCNQAYIDITIPQVNHQNFIFVAYSHGMPDHLQANAGFYIRSGINSDIFTNSFFYSMCCHSGKKLGNDLITGGCHAFIGYTDGAWALEGDCLQASIECDNFGIKRFISGDTLQEAFDAMKLNFDTQIDTLENNGSILAAAYLRENRDILIMLGDGDLRFSDF